MGGEEVGTDMPNERIGLGGGAGDNTCEGGDIGSDGDGIGGSGGEGIWGSGEDYGESGNDGGVDIARSLATSASDHTGVGTRAGIEILAVTRYAGCGGGCGRRLISLERLYLLRRMGPYRSW
ncbi:hypothetical protein Tco_1384713 [Tanacetum coccineum]